MAAKKRRIGAKSGFLGGAIAVGLLAFFLGGGFGLGPGLGTDKGDDENPEVGPDTTEVYKIFLVGDEIRHGDRVLTFDDFEILARRAQAERTTLDFTHDNQVRGVFVERIHAILKRVRVRYHGLD